MINQINNILRLIVIEVIKAILMPNTIMIIYKNSNKDIDLKTMNKKSSKPSKIKVQIKEDISFKVMENLQLNLQLICFKKHKRN